MDKRNEHHHEGGGFMNGFLLGAIIGAAVVFFLFTEKGKKMLKTITEEGIEGFGDIKDLIQEEMDEDGSSYDESLDDRYDEEEVYEEPEHHDQVTHHVEPLHHHEHEEHEYHDHAHEEHEHPAPSKVKRFFKGVKR